MKISILIFSLTFKGQILLKDSIPLKNYTFTLVELDSNLTPVDSLKLKTDPNGKFVVETDKKGIYLLKTNFQGISYRTDPLFENVENIKLSVYDTTSKSDKIVLNRAHIAFVLMQGIIQVVEVYNFFNTSDKLVKKTFELNMPDKATHILSLQGILPFELKIKGDTFLYTDGFKPGLKTISILYHIPLGKVKYERKMPTPVNELLVMMPPEIELKTKSQFEKTNINTTQGNFLLYSFKNLKSGDFFSFEIKLKEARKFKEFIPPLIFIVLLIIFLALIRKRWLKREVVSE
ncbi:MAG: hypothetical protein ABDH37_02925 [Candidatus Hydrothermales bacterium]